MISRAKCVKLIWTQRPKKKSRFRTDMSLSPFCLKQLPKDICLKLQIPSSHRKSEEFRRIWSSGSDGPWLWRSFVQSVWNHLCPKQKLNVQLSSFTNCSWDPERSGQTRTKEDRQESVQKDKAATFLSKISFNCLNTKAKGLMCIDYFITLQSFRPPLAGVCPSKSSLVCACMRVNVFVCECMYVCA